WYEAQRLLHDPALGAKLGVGAPAAASALAARNGFRPSASGGRAFEVAPPVSATNVVVEGAQAVGGDELLRSVGHGLYVGRIWYTYAGHGLSTGEFTVTV